MTDFASSFGREPDGVWAAPGRLNLIGEFTDYNDGFVLPMALESLARAFIGFRDDDTVRVASSGAPARAGGIVSRRLDELAPSGGGFWADYALGVVWAFAEAGYGLGGLDIYIDSDVPIGAGLSSSAALECAVALALCDRWAPTLPRPELARIAQRAENAFVGVPSGIMDQTASLCCTAGHAILFDTRSGAIEQVGLDLEGAGLALLVIDTAVRHELATSAYADRRAACERAARELGLTALRDARLADLELLGDDVVRRRARHIVTENHRVLAAAELLRSGRLAQVGHLLTESHHSLRDDFEVSCAELDLAVRSSLHAGALGARMIGGGFGGCAIALAAAQVADQLERSVRAAFRDHGFAPPRIFPAAPADGARRLG